MSIQERIVTLLVIFILFSSLVITENNNKNFPLAQTSEFEINIENEIINNTKQLLTHTPTIFTENRGQLKNDDVRFYVHGGSIWFTDDGVWFELKEEIEKENELKDIFNPNVKLELPKIVSYRRVILKQDFVDSNTVRPVGRERLSWNSNFFYGNDSSKWCTDVPNYQEIYYENLYDGIDLRYYTKDKGLKYDFIVYPGADLEMIKLKWEGTQGLEINKVGDMVIKNEIENLVDGELYIYQDYGGMKHQINGKFNLFNNFEYSYKIMNEYNFDEILVIDPKLEYSTFIGGDSRDDSYDIIVDSCGNAYSTGITWSLNFPTTPGANDTSHNGGTGIKQKDVFIFKINSNGSSLLYSTFIGGNDEDYGDGIALDSKGNALVTGLTRSLNFPITPGVINTSFNGGFTEGFILKLNSNGSLLQYSTYIGGTDFDEGNGIAVDSIGNAIVTGATTSQDFPITSGVYDTLYNGGTDIFVLKINPTGSSLIFSTFIGGGSSEYCGDMAIDNNGDILITGPTFSGNFPTKSGSYDTLFNGKQDAYVLKLNKYGTNLIFSTFVGGSEYDRGYGITSDLNRNVIVTGGTYSSDFPIKNAYDSSFNGTAAGWKGDAFILKLNPSGSKLLFSTFIGGDEHDGGLDIKTDFFGNIFVVGGTSSPDFPVTTDAFNSKLNNSNDVILFKMNSNGTLLNYSTFFGGNKSDFCRRMALDSMNNVYLAGTTYSANFPNTTGAFDNIINGKDDVFVSKFSFQKIINITSLVFFKQNQTTNLIYSGLTQYTIKTNLTYLGNQSNLKTVQLTLDPNGINIQMLWDHLTGDFLKISDPNNYITINSSSRAKNNLIWWTFDFNLTFNWTYPDEDFHDVQVYATSATLSPAWLNVTDIYRVENDLVFNGSLSVTGENDQIITNNSFVRGGEQLNWIGLKPVYEGTTDVYPPNDEFNVTIWDESNNYWIDSPVSGENFTIKTTASNVTNLDGETYTINISGIPLDCDKTDITFVLKIDGDNVSFSNPNPNNNTWQTRSNIMVSIELTDIGSGINESSIMLSKLLDNGLIWSEWKLVENIYVVNYTKYAKENIYLEDGIDNFIKWRAIDLVGNGPAESEGYLILVDTQNVTFSDPKPLDINVSKTNMVEIGITISDLISGVDASTIEYAISKDEGVTWDTWTSLSGLNDNISIELKINLTFSNGTDNRIKWRASDVAGNGPTESEIYVIIINTWLPPEKIPNVNLIHPLNGSILPSESIELSWKLLNLDLSGVKYDVYLDTQFPPKKIKIENHSENILLINNLENGKIYYWKIIPKLESIIGPESEIWSFTINVSHKPTFEFELKLSLSKIELKPGENKTINASVENLASIKDEITLSLDYEANKGILANIIEPKTIKIDPYNIFKFSIKVSANTNIAIKELLITIIAKSNKAPLYDQKVEKSEILTVKILEISKPDDGKENKDSESLNSMLGIAIVIIIIVIMIMIILLFIKKKKPEEITRIPIEPDIQQQPESTPDQIPQSPTQQPETQSQQLSPLIQEPAHQLGQIQTQEPIPEQQIQESTIEPQQIIQPQPQIFKPPVNPPQQYIHSYQPEVTIHQNVQPETQENIQNTSLPRTK